LVIEPVDKLAIVPTLVKLEPVTVAFNVVPDSDPAAADTVISALPSNATSLMFLGVTNFVAEAALPVVEPELPVTLPTIGLVTVRFVSVPTLVRLEPVTLAFKVVPDSVPAAAATVMSALPSNATPLMFLGVAKVVAVAALPVVEPELPVTLPTMGLVTVRFVSVPTLVRLEPVTVALRLVPVKVPAAAAGMFALTT
jgi:hypothetical protein